MVRKLKWDLEFWADNPMGGHLWRRAAWIPKVYWQRVSVLRWMWVVICGIPLLGYSICAWQDHQTPSLIGFTIIWVWAIILAVFPRVVFSRLKRQLLANDCLICLSCGYLLHGLPSEHVCPECGAPYRMDDLRQAWQHWLVHRRLPQNAESAPT